MWNVKTMGQVMYVDGDRGNYTEGTPEEDPVRLCQGEYGEFWPVL